MSVTPRNVDCAHEHFAANVAVARVTDEAGVVRNFVAEITVRCMDCDQPFHFVGPDAGLSFSRPTVSIGATTLHAPIAPGEAPIPSRVAYEAPPRSFE